ncbi:Histidinol-phosphate aminotransferase [hydrothermal vent metagenome]|uniref:Histidinol-phosphate aminotransferase n=1 Tax=hydrothermal vent metagenome TaxID=652676 RepID=A0A3B1A2K6_9ZZZZ
MTKFWSELTKQLQPYEAGEQPQDQHYLKLNTNENPFPPSEKALARIKQCAADGLRLYPDPDAQNLKQAISKLHSIKQDTIFVGNGSDEVLALSFMAFFKQQQAITFPDISYSFYPVYCKLFEIEYNCFELNSNFEIDLAAIPKNSGGIIFPNPNAPTSLYYEISKIEILLQRYPDIVVIIDEAYIDFGGQSCIALIDKYPNLLVIQTLSKSRSLAGLRVGYAVANSNLIAGLERVKNSFNSYPLDLLAIEGAVAAIEDVDYFTQCCDDIISTRQWLAVELTQLGFTVLPSKTNFVFVTHRSQSAKKLYQQLKQQAVLVRYFDKPKIDAYLRITIGLRSDMELFLKKLKPLLAMDVV